MQPGTVPSHGNNQYLRRLGAAETRGGVNIDKLSVKYVSVVYQVSSPQLGTRVAANKICPWSVTSSSQLTAAACGDGEHLHEDNKQ